MINNSPFAIGVVNRQQLSGFMVMDNALFAELILMNAAKVKKLICQTLPSRKMKKMKMIKHVCFDLDGTLVDSKETILESTKAALDQLKIEYVIDEDAFTNMIGMHFIDIFEELNIYVKDFEKFITIYKALYFDFMDSSTLYPGVKETLNNLTKKNVKVSLLTTKVQEQADKIIDHFNLRTSFDYLLGRRDGLAHKPSPESLLYICKELDVDPAETLMVGDTELDIQ